VGPAVRLCAFSSYSVPQYQGHIKYEDSYDTDSYRNHSVRSGSRNPEDEANPNDRTGVCNYYVSKFGFVHASTLPAVFY
jgi:hypothetical protein